MEDFPRLPGICILPSVCGSRFLTVERGILNLHTSGVFALRDANEVSHGCEGICKTELIY